MKLIINIYDGKGGFWSAIIEQNKVIETKPHYTFSDGSTIITLPKNVAKEVLKNDFYYTGKI